MGWVVVLLQTTIALSAPLILAAMGGFASERSGVVNIALEGNMIMAAIAAALIGTATKNPWMGLAGGILASTLMSWLHWLLTQSYRLDHIVSGMAINAIAIGASNFLDKRFTDPSGGVLPGLPLSLFFTCAFVLPFMIWLYMRRARGGLRLLAVGSDPGKARQMGVFPGRVRFLGLTATGIFCGLAGTLIVTNAKYFTDGMTAGRGFIALAALILGGWRPIPTLVASIGFGIFQGIELQLQGTPIFGVQVPREVWYALPYLVTVVALAGFLGKSKAPAGLGKP